MNVAKNEKPGWLFYPGWVVLNAVTVISAWYFAWGLISLIEKVVGGTIQVGGQSRITEDFLFFYVFLPVIGLLTGLVQFVLLRRYLRRMAWWLGATVLGWLLLFVIGSIVTPLLSPDNGTWRIMFGMFLVGAGIALPQWWMLRRRVAHAYWWIIACGFGWWSVGLLNIFTSDPLAVLVALALMPTIATSIACWLLLDWLPGRAGLSSTPIH